MFKVSWERKKHAMPVAAQLSPSNFKLRWLQGIVAQLPAGPPAATAGGGDSGNGGMPEARQQQQQQEAQQLQFDRVQFAQSAPTQMRSRSWSPAPAYSQQPPIRFVLCSDLSCGPAAQREAEAAGGICSLQRASATATLDLLAQLESAGKSVLVDSFEASAAGVHVLLEPWSYLAPLYPAVLEQYLRLYSAGGGWLCRTAGGVCQAPIPGSRVPGSSIARLR